MLVLVLTLLVLLPMVETDDVNVGSDVDVVDVAAVVIVVATATVFASFSVLVALLLSRFFSVFLGRSTSRFRDVYIPCIQAWMPLWILRRPLRWTLL